MNKKFIIGGVLILLFIILGGGYYFYSQQKAEIEESQVGGENPEKIMLTKEWVDPLGFTVKYADILSLDPHDEDQENYTHLEFAASPSAGRIIIWAKDPPSGTMEDWIKSDPELKDGLTIDTKWGKIPAKKISVKGIKPKIVTASLYDDLLYYMEVYPDKEGKLIPVYDQMVTDFIWYTVLEGGTTVPLEESIEETEYIDPQEGEDVIYEDEEVVE